MKFKIYSPEDNIPHLRTLHSLASMSKCAIRVSALLLQGNRIIGQGINSKKSHPLSEKYKYLRLGRNNKPLDHIGTHAEMSAINSVDPKILKKSYIMIFRIRRDGSIAPSYPCAMCAKALYDSGIREVRCII